MENDPLPNDSQRRALGEFLQYAFCAMRQEDDPGVTQALADALHNIPVEMYAPGVWSVRRTRRDLMIFEKRHGGSFVEMFDEIFPPNADN
ncbi:MAG TPA: hypothetical protein VN496_02580 [Burkholderiales bacterium]|nr:hypothetical protein [Burkholderiales bacterium]